jgi:endonuclease/exonuclease/phosphatase (EEP) superfamily protein YafD
LALTLIPLWLTALTACRPAEPGPRPPLARGLKEFKVMSFNVNWGGPDMGRSAAAILKSDPDVAALQETTPGWERFLRRRLGARYRFMTFRHGSGAGGMAFLSKWPLRDLGPTAPPSGGWFFAWHAEVKTPKGPVHLLNVHLRPPLGESGRTSTVVSAYFKTRSVRLREIKYHMAHVRGRRPLIVLGDFNESADGRAARWLKRRGFVDALEKYDPKTATWKWRTSIYTFRKRLDHIFYSRGLRCVDAQVLGPAGSDHYPVEAVFRFPQAR